MFSVTVEARWGILRLKFFFVFNENACYGLAWSVIFRCYIYTKQSIATKNTIQTLRINGSLNLAIFFARNIWEVPIKWLMYWCPYCATLKGLPFYAARSYVGKNLDCRCSLFFCNHACLSRPGACRVVDLISDTTTASPAINSAPQYVLISSHPPYLCLLFVPAETRVGEKIWNEGLLFVSQLPVVERMTPKTLTYFGLSWQQGNHDFGNSASAIGGSTGFLLVETVQTLFKVWQIQSRTCLYQNGQMQFLMRFYVWRLDCFPGPKALSSLPILGHSYMLGSEPIPVLRTLHKRHGDIVRFDLGPNPTILVGSYDMLLDLFKREVWTRQDFLLRNTDSYDISKGF